MATTIPRRRPRPAVLAGLLLAPLVAGSAFLGLEARQPAPDLVDGVRLGDSREHALAVLAERGLEATVLPAADGGEQLVLDHVPPELSVDEAPAAGVVVVHLADGRVTGFTAAFESGDDPVFLFDELAARWADRLGRPELDERWTEADGSPGLQVEWSGPRAARITLDSAGLRLGSWSAPHPA